jgi:aryl-alcohol dehydrogenase-like predicted oxidoreductase
MEKRILGRSDLAVAPLAFGGNVFGWTVDEKGCFELLDRFEANGFNFIDTADSYSNWVPGNPGGVSESYIGNWMHSRKNRHKMIIATKVGSSLVRGGKKNLKAEYIMKQVEFSLSNLKTDYIDLYQAHYDDLETDPHETLEAFHKLVQSGKVRWIGASNFSPERLELSLKISSDRALTSYISLQPEYNLYDREKYESQYASIAEAHHLGVIPYYSLASGFLSGKYRSEADLNKSPRGEGIRKYLNKRGFRILSALDDVAKKYNSSPASISLAWLLTRTNVVAPICSATNIAQLNQLMDAVRLNLNQEDTDLLTSASALLPEDKDS